MYFIKKRSLFGWQLKILPILVRSSENLMIRQMALTHAGRRAHLVSQETKESSLLICSNKLSEELTWDPGELFQGFPRSVALARLLGLLPQKDPVQGSTLLSRLPFRTQPSVHELLVGIPHPKPNSRKKKFQWKRGAWGPLRSWCQQAPALARWRQKNQKCWAILSYVVSSRPTWALWDFASVIKTSKKDFEESTASKSLAEQAWPDHLSSIFGTA